MVLTHESTTANFARRLAAHLRAGTTDQAPTTYPIASEAYSNRDTFEQERDVLKRVPIMAALSTEVPAPHDYRSVTILGIPLIVVRGEDGVVRAFLNACRHRGTVIMDEGCGNERRFKCPYHGWNYDTQGALRGVLAERSFGEIDKQSHGLVEFPCSEELGLVFVRLVPDGDPINVAEWLGDEIYRGVENLNLANATLVEEFQIPGTNWKTTLEGFLEAYHFLTLHEQTFQVRYPTGTGIHGNVLAVNKHGNHVWSGVAFTTIDDYLDRPEDEWNSDELVAMQMHIFPNLFLPILPSKVQYVIQVWPGDDVTSSRSDMRIISHEPVETEEDFQTAKAFSTDLRSVIEEEDYWATGRQQQALVAGGDVLGDFILGRNELVLHYFHDTLDHYRRALAK